MATLKVPRQEAAIYSERALCSERMHQFFAAQIRRSAQVVEPMPPGPFPFTVYEKKGSYD